jgi:uncharacterized membrane protein (UPF0127 family)
MVRRPPEWEHGAVLSTFRDPPDWLFARTRLAAWIVLALGIFAFLIVGANRPANPHLLPPQGLVTNPGLTEFGATSFTVSAGPGLSTPARPLCALLAYTAALRGRGLIDQRSLHRFAGMIFAYPGPSTTPISDKGVLLALSIAWFDGRGRFVGSLNLAPCPPSSQFCPTYDAGRSFQLAIEVPRSKLSSLGIGPGSTLQLAGPCSG